jgi:FkbM family methyltransferase
MKINYFDLGLFHGTELCLMMNSIMPSIGLNNIAAYGFEPCEESFKAASIVPWVKNDDKVRLFNYAVCDGDGEKKLYHANNNVGNSLYKTKKNLTDEYEVVKTVKMSNWLQENVPTFEEDINIIKMNIEGAEYEVLRDLEENNMLQHVSIFCGTGDDIDKIPELSDVKKDFERILKENDITIHHFSARADIGTVEPRTEEAVESAKQAMIERAKPEPWMWFCMTVETVKDGVIDFQFFYEIEGNKKNVNMCKLILEAIENKRNGEKNV